MNQTAEVIPFCSPAREIFHKQRAAFRRRPFVSLAQRRDILLKLEAMLIDHQESIAMAISRDFGHRSVHETKILEIFPAVAGLRYARRHLKQWMNPQQRHVAF